MKICFKCKEEKPLAEFYKHKQMADGHLNKCIVCTKIDVKNRYIGSIDYIKEYEKGRALLPHRVKLREEYAKSEGGKIARDRSRKNWQRRNPIKRMASIIVGNAVRDGKLIKLSHCEKCGNEPNRLHGHHDDYAFPLVVRWLCPACHNKWHKENGEGANAS